MHEPPLYVTMIFCAVLTGMIVTLAFEERIHAKKSLITGIYAILSLALGHALGVLPFGPQTNAWGETLRLPVYVLGIDWAVIAIILGSSHLRRHHEQARVCSPGSRSELTKASQVVTRCFLLINCTG